MIVRGEVVRKEEIMDSYFLSYLLIFVGFFITLYAQIHITNTYKKYAKVNNKKGLTGRETARQILDSHGLSNIYIVETNGFLSDHYDPSRKVIRLSREIYHGTSISSLAVAAHECGHAIQDKENYSFLRFRSMFIPIVNFASYAGYFALLFGILFQALDLIYLGIALEFVMLYFQLITLPVEFDASKRALQILEGNYLEKKEKESAKKVLTAAALTYVASVVTTLLEIARLLLIFGNRDDS